MGLICIYSQNKFLLEKSILNLDRCKYMTFNFLGYITLKICCVKGEFLMAHDREAKIQSLQAQ